MPAGEMKPDRLTIRSYNVQFGDAFLLTFHYPSAGMADAFDRHVLIDFGAVRGSRTDLGRVAKAIRKDCGGQHGKLHAVVATHRHKDHIRGFETADDDKGPGDVICALKPDVIVQPWTEDPRAAEDARGPSPPLQPASRAFAASLQSMCRWVAQVAAEREVLERSFGPELNDPGVQKQLQTLDVIGGINIANENAVKNLLEMGNRNGASSHYVFYGCDNPLKEVLPGVDVHVLGPPTVEQTDKVARHYARSSAEYWELQAKSVAGMGLGTRPAQSPIDREFHDRQSGWPRYLQAMAPRLRRMRLEQVLQIVRALDDMLNNTSVILLFEAGNQKLLFSGDAQAESWLYALEDAEDHERVRERLADVTVYKVGHHASHNATPKTLWDGFTRRNATCDGTRLKTLLSSKREVYPGIPRASLMDALTTESELHSTLDLDEGSDPITLEFHL